MDINSSNATGIAALNGLFNDPTQFYINMHTTVNPGGVIRADVRGAAGGATHVDADERHLTRRQLRDERVVAVHADQHGDVEAVRGCVAGLEE